MFSTYLNKNLIFFEEDTLFTSSRNCRILSFSIHFWPDSLISSHKKESWFRRILSSNIFDPNNMLKVREILTYGYCLSVLMLIYLLEDIFDIFDI